VSFPGILGTDVAIISNVALLPGDVWSFKVITTVIEPVMKESTGTLYFSETQQHFNSDALSCLCIRNNVEPCWQLVVKLN
jgi:hypothetical protein